MSVFLFWSVCVAAYLFISEKHRTILSPVWYVGYLHYNKHQAVRKVSMRSVFCYYLKSLHVL